MHTTIQVALAFLKAETEDYYQWALACLREILGEGLYPSILITDRELALISRIRDIFPRSSHLLCVWHVNTNVLKACKPYFDTDELWQAFYAAWHSVVNATTEDIYVERLIEFRASQPQIPVDYCVNNWLYPWKERIVRAWTDKLHHFGHTVTSRIEGCHAKIKQYLGTSSGDLKAVYDKLSLYWQGQYTEYLAELEKGRTRIQHRAHHPLYAAITGNVYPYAIGKIIKQQQKLPYRPLPRCTGTFRTSMGLPCSHDLAELDNQPIRLALIHPHWHYIRPQIAASLTEIYPIQVSPPVPPLVQYPAQYLAEQPAAPLAQYPAEQSAAPPAQYPAAPVAQYPAEQPAQPPILDPEVVRRGRGRPRGATSGRGRGRGGRNRAGAGPRGTRRQPSAFEAVEAIELPSSTTPA